MTFKLLWSKEGNSTVRHYPDRKVDTYGHEVKSYRRHKDCGCKVPCQARFTCEAVDHAGRRATPFCSGCYDDEPGWCDTCWNRKHERKTA